MKRFSLRSTVLLMLPCLLLPIMALTVSRLANSPDGIEVQTSARRPPSANGFSQGADVGVIVKLNERPDNNTDITWATFFRVDAGNHALWNSKNGDGARRISLSTHGFDGAWRQWDGDFNLKSVPSAWGDVVFSWQARLTHGRAWNLAGKSFALSPDVSNRSGKILLRRVGEKLNYGPKISRNPHLKFLDWEISRLKKLKSGSTYRVRLFCKRDLPLEGTTSSDFASRIELKAGTKAWSDKSVIHGFYGSLEDHLNFPSQAAENANRITTFTQDIDVFEHPNRAHIEAKISFRDFWPISISVPFSDEKSRVLLHPSGVKMPGIYVG